jgi:hypothetical protein
MERQVQDPRRDKATDFELKRAHGIGRLRVRRLAKTCFAVACKLTAQDQEMGQGLSGLGKAFARLYGVYWGRLRAVQSSKELSA